MLKHLCRGRLWSSAVAFILLAAGFGWAVWAKPADDSKYHLVILRLGPNYLPERAPQEQVGFSGHAQYMRELSEARILILGGPLIRDTSAFEPTGAMLILKSATKEEAQRLTEADPGYAAGLLALQEIRPVVLASGHALQLMLKEQENPTRQSPQ